MTFYEGIKHAAVPCIEGGHAINDSLAVLRLYHELGIRYITLTHFNTNNWADASTDAPRNDGLSLFGRDPLVWNARVRRGAEEGRHSSLFVHGGIPPG